MEPTLVILLGSAVGIGFLHAVIGVDHWLPFAVLGRAQSWPLRRVLAVTAACGVGHVLSSVVLGALGIGLGVAVTHLEAIEGVRGNLAAWMLIVFGVVYAAWSVARPRRAHRHIHAHADGEIHVHAHEGLPHGHATRDARTVTAWSLFVIFVLGPCEPLIPLLMAPAIASGAEGVALVAVVFGVTTIATMAVMVAVVYAGLSVRVFRRLQAHAHPLAGVAIALSGLAIRLLGI
ncbi:MAG: sulfite exporter TauE/SafE family protein [Candidatus Krumholzibacteria bacterium]|nr:sulfite exporter TauE/SafE family protein [Candidatus Krumholzibacteria bacterium]